MARIHTIEDYQLYHVTARESIRRRYCPGMTPIWSFRTASYNPFGRPSNEDRIRRVAMILTLACRTLLDVINLYRHVMSLQILGIVIALILSLIGFFFIAWCLATIGDAEGERTVMKYDVVSSCGHNRSTHVYSARTYDERCRQGSNLD